MKRKIRNYLGTKLTYHYRPGVIGDDYYKDHLVKNLPNIISPTLKQKSSLKILDMATGHGYSAIMLAKHYQHNISKIVAYDINPKAVNLAKHNAQLNSCPGGLIDFRIGSIYEPLSKNEKFDVIISALPPVPITGKQLQALGKSVRSHHWIESTGGKTGRDLIDKMINGCVNHLNADGIVITVHADFLNFDKTLRKMRKAGLTSWIEGSLKSKKLKDTSLTLARKDAIVDLGYRFTGAAGGDEGFFIGVLAGKNNSVITS